MMKYPTNNEIWYAEQRDLAIEERDAAITRAEAAEAEIERAEAKAHEFESEAIHNGEIMQSLAAEVTALRERIAELETKNIVATEGKYARTEYMSYWTYDELLIRAQAAEAEVAALKARIAELEAAASASSGAAAALDEIEQLMWGDDND